MILQIRRGRARFRRRPVSGPMFLVGRGANCDLVLGDPQFSDVHFYLWRQKTGTRIRRMGDSPELTVNGQVTTSRLLNCGDRIRTGPFEFYVCGET
jgi:hypothetical protein